MKKHFLAILGAVLLCAALCGCGVNKEEVVNRIFEEKADSFHCDTDVALDFTLGMGGMSLDMGMDGRVQLDFDGTDKDASAIYALVDFTASAMGNKNRVNGETYVITEDGVTKNYAKDLASGNWSVNAVETTQGVMDEASRQKILDELKNILMMADLSSKTQTVGSEECYELKMDTDGSIFNNMVDIAWDAVDSETRAKLREQGFEISTVKAFLPMLHIDATIYTSKDSGRIVEIDVDLSKTDTEALIAEAMKSAGPLAGAMGIDLSQIKLTLSKTEFSFRLSDYNNVKVEVPQDVRDAAEGGEEEYEEEEEDYAE